MVKAGALRAALVTLGCRVNFSETDHLRAQLQAAGYHLVGFDQVADLYVVNTCTVTQVADRKSRQLLRQAVRRGQGALVVAAGCYADVAAPLLQQIEGVDLVVTREEDPHLVERIAAAFRARGSEPPSARGKEAPLLPASPARALIQVQDGCDNRCAYCIVSIARGPSRSRPAAVAMAEIRAVERAGYREIILTGINLGVYRDTEGTDLASLAGRILAETRVERIRFSSIEPQDFPRSLLDLWPEPRLCRHFHLPLQSGCDRTLARMGRKYNWHDFRVLAEDILRRVPDVALTTDLIAGFPGETEEEFVESMAAIATVPFSDLHIFPFSPRPGTAAVRMPDPVPPAIRRKRCEQMHLLGERMARTFRQRFLGRTLAVLWDGQHRGTWTGLSDNYLRVGTSAEGEWLGQITDTRLVGLEGTNLAGQIVTPPVAGTGGSRARPVQDGPAAGCELRRSGAGAGTRARPARY